MHNIFGENSSLYHVLFFPLQKALKRLAYLLMLKSFKINYCMNFLIVLLHICIERQQIHCNVIIFPTCTNFIVSCWANMNVIHKKISPGKSWNVLKRVVFVLRWRAGWKAHETAGECSGVKARDRDVGSNMRGTLLYVQLGNSINSKFIVQLEVFSNNKALLSGLTESPRCLLNWVLALQSGECKGEGQKDWWVGIKPFWEWRGGKN